MIIAVFLSAAIVAGGMGVIWYVRSFTRAPRAGTTQKGAGWNGAAFDSKVVADRLQHLRENYLTALASRPDDELQRKDRLAATRRTVSARSYFRHLHADVPESITESRAHG